MPADQPNGVAAHPLTSNAERLRLAYRLAPDDYRGGTAVQLIVEHREPA